MYLSFWCPLLKTLSNKDVKSIVAGNSRRLRPSSKKRKINPLLNKARGHTSTQAFCSLSGALIACPCTSKVTASDQNTEPMAASLDWSPGVTFTVTTCLYIKPPLRSFISTYPHWLLARQPFWEGLAASEGRVTSWQTPSFIPSSISAPRPKRQHKPLYHAMKGESHPASTFVPHVGTHKRQHCKTKPCKLFHTKPNYFVFLSNGSDKCINPGRHRATPQGPPLTAAPKTPHTTDTKPQTLWSKKGLFTYSEML